MERFQSQRNSLGKLGPQKISEFGPQEICQRNSLGESGPTWGPEISRTMIMEVVVKTLSDYQGHNDRGENKSMKLFNIITSYEIE